MSRCSVTSLVSAAAVACVVGFAWRRWSKAKVLKVEALQKEILKLARQLREGRHAWKLHEGELKERLQDCKDRLQQCLIESCRDPDQGLRSHMLEAQLSAAKVFELQVCYGDQDRVTELVLEQQPLLAKLDTEEFLQRLAAYGHDGDLLPPLGEKLPSAKEIYPVHVRYSEPQVKVVNPRLRGIRLADLLCFFERDCGDIAFGDDDLAMQPICMPTKLARLCNRHNLRAAQLSAGKKFRELQPNMYAVESLLIRRMTESSRLSLAELWSPEGALIDIFISHYWGEDFGEFVQSTYRFTLSRSCHSAQDCSRGPEEARERAGQLSIYICAFSNNQWNLYSEMGSQVEDSPFYKVLKADTTSTVVMNLDQMATSLLRAWCDFEFYFSHVLQKNVVLNCRFGPLQQLGCTGADGKVAELWMLHVFELLQDVDIKLATATREEDLKLIQEEISTFTGSGLALGFHGAEAINRLLKATISSEVLPVLARLGNLPALSKALECGASVEVCDHLGIRPLTYAAAHHGPESPVAAMLIKHKADPMAVPHAECILQLFSESSNSRKSALTSVNALLSSAERKYHRVTLAAARRQHASKCRSLLRALSQEDCTSAYAQQLAHHFASETKELDATMGHSGLASRVHTPAESHVHTPELRRSGTHTPEHGILPEDVSKALRSKRLDIPSTTEHWHHTIRLVPPSEASSHSTGLLPIALQHLEHQDAGLRQAACEVLAELGEASHTPQLLGCLEDESSEVRVSAIAALVQVGCEAEHVPAVARCLDDSDSDVREAACKALGETGAPEAVAQVMMVLQDPAETVRSAALEALGQLPVKETAAHADSIAEQLQLEEACEVKIAALGTLGLIKEEAAEHTSAMAECLRDSNWRVREAACNALANLGGRAEEHIADVAELLQDSDCDVREAAVAALGQIGHAAEAHVSEIVNCLSDGDAEVRNTAVSVLGQLGEVAAPHVANVADCLTDPVADVRENACEALGQISNSAAIEALRNFLLRREDGDVQRYRD